MGLLDLPPELLQRVVAHYVKRVGAIKAWQLRDVSPTLGQYVSYEVLAKQPIRRFLGRKSEGRDLIKKHLALIISYRAKKACGMHNFLPDFLDRTMKLLAKHGGATTNATEAEHIDILSKLIAAMCSYAYHLVIVDVGRDIHVNKIIEFKENHTANMIAAASAVGNLRALQHFVSRNHENLWKQSVAFGYPLAAAAYAGQLEMVKIIYKQCRVPDNWEESKIRQQCLVPAMQAAIRADHFIIVDFLLKAGWYDFPELVGAACKELLTTSVLTGDIKYVSLILDCGAVPTREAIKATFCLAVKHNHHDIALHLCKNGHLPVDNVIGVNRSPLSVAAGCERVKLVEELLNMGASPDGPLALRRYSRLVGVPLNVAVLAGNRNIVQLLLDRGANAHLIEMRLGKINDLHIAALINERQMCTAQPTVWDTSEYLKDIPDLPVPEYGRQA